MRHAKRMHNARVRVYYSFLFVRSKICPSYVYWDEEFSTEMEEKKIDNIAMPVWPLVGTVYIYILIALGVQCSENNQREIIHSK